MTLITKGLRNPQQPRASCMDSCMVKPLNALQATYYVNSHKPSTRSTQMLLSRQIDLTGDAQKNRYSEAGFFMGVNKDVEATTTLVCCILPTKPVQIINSVQLSSLKGWRCASHDQGTGP